MEYISLSWCDISEPVVPIRIYLIEGCCYQRSYWTKGSSGLSWSHHFESFTVATMTWLTVIEYRYLCHKWPWLCSTCRKRFRSFPHSWLITGFVTRLTRRVPLVEQELFTLPEHLSSPPVFSGVRITRSLVLCVFFVDRCLSFCTFSFGHCVLFHLAIVYFFIVFFDVRRLFYIMWLK
jgi:hypothetical protein